MTEPPRLLDNDQLPANVREGLRSLQTRDPDAAAIARVQRVLEGLPPAPRGRGTYGPSALRILAIVAAAGLGALFVMRGRNSPQPPAADPSAASSAPMEVVSGPPLIAAAIEVAPAAPTSAPAAAAVSVPVARHVAASARRIASREPEATRASQVSRPASPPPVTDKQTASATSAKVARSEQVFETERLQPVSAQPAARVPVQSAEQPLPEPTDEAGLLFKAKRLAPRNPNAALRLLESHAFYFPNGAFVQEREVLAIQLHRRLGHTTEARLLAERFRARFPDSVYRNAVAP